MIVNLHELQRCQSIRWLLNADRKTHKNMALSYMMSGSFFSMYTLFNGYYETLVSTLYTVIPDMDCVKLVIEKAKLLNLFYTEFFVDKI